MFIWYWCYYAAECTVHLSDMLTFIVPRDPVVELRTQNSENDLFNLNITFYISLNKYIKLIKIALG